MALMTTKTITLPLFRSRLRRDGLRIELFLMMASRLILFSRSLTLIEQRIKLMASFRVSTEPNPLNAFLTISSSRKITTEGLVKAS
jgi:hypothetical protein